MKPKIENIFVFEENGKSTRLHLDHTRDIGTYNKSIVELVFTDLGGKKIYPVARSGMKYAKRVDADICCFVDDLDIKELNKNDDLYIFYGGKIQYATFDRWENAKCYVWLYGEQEIKKGMSYHLLIPKKDILARPHDFELIEGTETYKCTRCDAISTRNVAQM